MATQNKRKMNEEVMEAVELVETADDLQNALSVIMAEAGVTEHEAVAHVYLLDRESNEEPKIWKGPAEDYDLDKLAHKFGSGSYRLKVYAKDDGTGKFVLRLNRVIPYRLSAEEDARLKAIRSGEVPVSQLNGNAQPTITAETIAQAIRAAMPAPAPVVPAISPIEMVKAFAEVLKAVTPVSQVPQMNPVDVLRVAAGFIKDNTVGSDPIERGVNATGMDVFMRLVDRFAPMFEKTIAQAVQGQPAGLPNPHQMGNAQPGGTPMQPMQPVQPIQPIQPGDDVTMKLRMGLNFLCMQAQAGNDPETYADVILDNVPEKELKEMFAQPDWLDRLAAFDPNVKNHAKWFGELKEACEDTLNAPPEGVDTTHTPAPK